MVYFLNELENKFLTLELRPRIRQNPVPEELRGWNWHIPPLKPYYNVKLPMYLICSRYCPTSRDVYLTMVEKVRGEESFPVTLGKAIHEAVAKAIRDAKNRNFSAEPPKYDKEMLNVAVKAAWEYTMSLCQSSYLKVRSEQPYATEEDVLLTSLPFLVEHRMDGSLLGCSGLISVDCYDYLRNIVFDLKVGELSEEMRLYTTGYALVLESIHEIPVDVGCIVSITFNGERMRVSKDIHYIDANLRSWWIEERDRKAEIVFNEADPGIAKSCSSHCLFNAFCL